MHLPRFLAIGLFSIVCHGAPPGADEPVVKRMKAAISTPLFIQGVGVNTLAKIGRAHV